jgi:hypothetical protein
MVVVPAPGKDPFRHTLFNSPGHAHRLVARSHLGGGVVAKRKSGKKERPVDPGY